MALYTKEEIKSILDKERFNGYEPELEIVINHTDYMIIAYRDYYEFMKESYDSDVAVYTYDNFDELYENACIDNMRLKDNWDNIEAFNCDALVYNGALFRNKDW